MDLAEIADLLAEWRTNKEEQRCIRDEMARIAVQVLGLPQEEVSKRISDIPSILDGYLIGKGVRQRWRDAA